MGHDLQVTAMTRTNVFEVQLSFGRDFDNPNVAAMKLEQRANLAVEDVLNFLRYLHGIHGERGSDESSVRSEMFIATGHPLIASSVGAACRLVSLLTELGSEGGPVSINRTLL